MPAGGELAVRRDVWLHGLKASWQIGAPVLPIPRLILSGAWKDRGALSQSLAGWEAEYERQHPRYTRYELGGRTPAEGY